MKRSEWLRRVNARLAKESEEPNRWWFLSFASEEAFLGGLFLEAHGVIHAIQEAYRRGINPGGSVQGHTVPQEHLPPRSYLNRLLTKQEMEEINT